MVTVKDGTVDADNWTIDPASAKKGQTVTVKYNGTKKVKSVKAVKKAAEPSYTLLSAATTADVGKIAGADGKIYDTKAAAEAVATGNAIAMIAYVGDASDCTTGLAIALEDVSSDTKSWSQAAGAVTTWASGKTAPTTGSWRLPSIKDWQYMFIGCGASGSYSDNPSGVSMSYSGLKGKLTAADGTALETGGYWSSTESESSKCWYPNLSGNNANFLSDFKYMSKFVRACLAF